MKLIEKHKEWCEAGELTWKGGLCREFLNNAKYYDTLKLFRPSMEEEVRLIKENLQVLFWGSGLHSGDAKALYTYTELRQNIVLLICAMHNEL